MVPHVRYLFGMSITRWPPSRLGVLIVAVAWGLILWGSITRIRRVEYVSNLPVAAVTPDRASKTGYADGIRLLVVPDQNPASYQWIVQTQQMLAEGEWRLRHVEYDNAPDGRAVHTPSPYRWWLGFVAALIEGVTDVPTGIAVERAALWADPVLGLFLVLFATLFVARWAGAWSAAGLAIGLTIFYPLAAVFVPGQPDSVSLACVCVLGSLLPLLVGASARGGSKQEVPPVPRNPERRWFVIAGIAGGLGLWIDVRLQVPVLIGIAGGALLMAWLGRGGETTPVTRGTRNPWRAWGISGAVTAMAAYLLEYFPGHLDVLAWRLEVNHPLYAIAWLGGGEILARATDAIRSGGFSRRKGDVVMATLAVLAVAAVPVTMLVHDTRGFLTAGVSASRISRLSDEVIAMGLGDLLARDTAAAIGALLPVVVLIAGAIWKLMRTSLERARHAPVALGLGAVVMTALFAVFRLPMWSVVGCTTVVLLTAVIACRPADRKGIAWRVILTGAALALVPGTVHLLGSTIAARSESLTESEAQSLLERDLAHWLNLHAGEPGAIVLAPPTLTGALIYFGGVRGVATPYWENELGFTAVIRIAAATSLPEVDSLLRRRRITHVIVPSWDDAMQELARHASSDPAAAFISQLQEWLPPRSLRAVPYEAPHMSGFASRSVAIFKFMDVQDDVVALSRLAEYFVETDRLEFAARVSYTLEEKYPNDVGAMVARAQVAAAFENATEFGRVFRILLEALTRQEHQALPWDRRVNLAIMLAYGERRDLARTELQACLRAMDEEALRLLTTVTLFRMQSLAKASGLTIDDTTLRELALRLLPAGLRGRLQ